ncbi:MAG: hypothetical protein ABIV50_12360 [Opitutus sp.]
MEDLPDALRRHYEERRLPLDRAASILAAGRVQAAHYHRRQQRRWFTAMAALLLIGLGIAGSWVMHSARSSPRSTPISVADVSHSVVQFFAASSPALGLLSPHVSDLQAWLAGKGAPASFVVPSTLETLESLGCQVLDVRGQHVSLFCFLLDPVRPDSTQENLGPGGAAKSAAEPNRSLVHLLIAPRAAFAQAPRVGERVRLAPEGNWKFVAWSKGDLVFVAASEAAGSSLSAVFGAL